MVVMFGLDLILIFAALFLLSWIIANALRYIQYLSENNGGWFLGLSDYLIRKDIERNKIKKEKKK